MNLSVAGFTGSPAMNVVTAEPTRDGGPVVTFAVPKLAVPAAVTGGEPGLGRYAGRRIILGTRPSGFEHAASPPPPARLAEPVTSASPWAVWGGS